LGIRSVTAIAALAVVAATLYPATTPSVTPSSAMTIERRLEALETTQVVKFQPVSDVEKLDVVPMPKRMTATPHATPRKATRRSPQPPVTYRGSGSVVIRSVAREMGCTSKEIEMLLYIAKHESGLRCNAVSRTGKYVGLFQLGPHLGTYEQRIDPNWNTRRAIKYMRGRYGSIARAYAFKRSHGWY